MMNRERHDQHETARTSGKGVRQRSARRWFLNLSCLAVLLLIGGVSFAFHRNRNRPPAQPIDPPIPVVQHTMTPGEIRVPLGLPEVNCPADNPLTTEKVVLGRRLFFDSNLSADRSISCASCHDPAKGWTNGERFAVGVGGATGTRNVPTIINVAFNRRQFWDGRVRTLESQALGPILNPVEMAMPSRESIVERIQEDAEYEDLFARAFPDGTTADNIGRALAAFERTVLAGNAPYDRFEAGDKQAMSPAAQRGLDVFLKKGNCAGCHGPPLFTDNMFYNLGIGMDQEEPDVGFFAVTKSPTSLGRFKTPTVRDVAKTAPYMHDGSIATLEEVVDFYDKGGHPNSNLDRAMRRLRLTDQEKRELVQFMVEGLSSDTATP